MCEVAKGCLFRLSSASAMEFAGGTTELSGCAFHPSSGSPSNFISPAGGSCKLLADGCDFSLGGSSIVYGSSGPIGNLSALFSNCKIPAAATWLSSPSPGSIAAVDVTVFNCASGDTHYNFGFYNALGEVVSQTGIYANGAKYDGTNGVGWQITTTSAARYSTPFVTPWIEFPLVEGLAAITPSVEIVRSGSSTAYQDDEVWGEFAYQGTSGSPLSVFVNDRMALLGTPANQDTGSLGASDWTGENATSWYGKLAPSSAITPVEIGTLRARIYVGEPSITVYADPQIRGAGQEGLGINRSTSSGWVQFGQKRMLLMASRLNGVLQ